MSDAKAYKFQITQDGIWEEALQFSLNMSQEEKIDKINNFFNNLKSQDVAFEFFFNEDDRFLFFGMRIEKLDNKLKLEKIILLIKSIYNQMLFDDALNQIKNILNTDVKTTKSDFKEVGFEGFWKSRGSQVVLDDKLSLSYDELIETNPQFNKKYDDRFIMMEMAWRPNDNFNIKHPYWIAKQLSSNHGVIDPEGYAILINQ